MTATKKLFDNAKVRDLQIGDEIVYADGNQRVDDLTWELGIDMRKMYLIYTDGINAPRRSPGSQPITFLRPVEDDTTEITADDLRTLITEQEIPATIDADADYLTVDVEDLTALTRLTLLLGANIAQGTTILSTEAREAANNGADTDALGDHAATTLDALESPEIITSEAGIRVMWKSLRLA